MPRQKAKRVWCFIDWKKAYMRCNHHATHGRNTVLPLQYFLAFGLGLKAAAALQKVEQILPDSMPADEFQHKCQSANHPIENKSGHATDTVACRSKPLDLNPLCIWQPNGVTLYGIHVPRHVMCDDRDSVPILALLAVFEIPRRNCFKFAREDSQG